MNIPPTVICVHKSWLTKKIFPEQKMTKRLIQDR